MPMFEAHIAISMGFIALVVGTSFLAWIKKQEIDCLFTKLVGYATVFFSITGLLCTTYYSVRYWEDGYFKAPMIITHDQTPSSLQNHEDHHP